MISTKKVLLVFFVAFVFFSKVFASQEFERSKVYCGWKSGNYKNFIAHDFDTFKKRAEIYFESDLEVDTVFFEWMKINKKKMGQQRIKLPTEQDSIRKFNQAFEKLPDLKKLFSRQITKKELEYLDEMINEKIICAGNRLSILGMSENFPLIIACIERYYQKTGRLPLDKDGYISKDLATRRLYFAVNRKGPCKTPTVGLKAAPRAKNWGFYTSTFFGPISILALVNFVLTGKLSGNQEAKERARWFLKFQREPLFPDWKYGTIKAKEDYLKGPTKKDFVEYCLGKVKDSLSLGPDRFEVAIHGLERRWDGSKDEVKTAWMPFEESQIKQQRKEELRLERLDCCREKNFGAPQNSDGSFNGLLQILG